MRPLPPSLLRSIEQRGDGLTVLVLRLAAFGDILRTLPAVRLLRRGLPAARIFWILDDRWHVAVRDHVDLDGVVLFPRRDRRDRGRLGSIRDFRGELRSLGPDLLVDFHGNLRSGVVGRLSGAPVRLGYAGHQQKEINRWFTTHRVASGDRRTPRIERNLDLVRALGLPDAPLPRCDLPLAARGAPEAERIVRELIGPSTPFAVINPGASVAQAHKRPPAELLASVCDRLERRGVRPLLVWGPGEERDADRVLSGSRGATLAPPTDLATLAALIARARLFVGGDSGPLHLACAVDCPVLAIYGPTDPRVNGPWAVPHRAVAPAGRAYTGIKSKDRVGGFEGLRVEDVTGALEALLEETQARG